MKLMWIWIAGVLVLMVALAGGDAFAGGSLKILDRQGGELGNSFVPFDSKIGDYSLEYKKQWRLNDLSLTANFSDPDAGNPSSPSFVALSTKRTGGPQTETELMDQLKVKHPGIEWAKVRVAGLTGLGAEVKGVATVYVLRSPGDLLAISFRSTEGERTDYVISHMLSSLRLE